nr:odorant binding protein 9 [Ceracris nigricornis]
MASALCLLAAAHTRQPRPHRYATGHKNLNESVASCNKTYPVSADTLLERALNNGTLPDETNENARCFIECMERAKGTVNNDGTWNTTRAEQIEFDNNVAHGRNVTQDIRKIIEECSTMSGSGSCMTVYLIKKCVDQGMSPIREPLQFHKLELDHKQL